MPGKEKGNGEKITVLKGIAAEKKVLDYVKEMNRPFGAADICANLKGAVAKASVQKILVALAEKGEITQKAYAKTLVFVANQAELNETPVETLEALEAEGKHLNEENKTLSGDVKTCSQELNQLRNTPTDLELERLLCDADQTHSILLQQLQPLRLGQSLVTVEDLALLETEWQKWRMQWVERKKVFYALYSIATGAMAPQECEHLVEELGIEYDTPEHKTLENSLLCKVFATGRR